MSDIQSLASRIDTEFTAVEEKLRKFQVEQVQDYQGRQKRLGQLGQAFEDLREIWKPRLELLAGKFGERVKVTPRLTPSTREASFEFQSMLARIRLRLSASTDRDVRNLVLSYDLEIIPMLMKYDSHVEAAFPLERIDKEAVARWVDDRIVDFVHSYLALGENDVYLKDHMVEDPVAHVHFPKLAAAATLEWKGKTYYFVGEETRREFARQNQIVAP
jgi:YHS domain-containing protein